MSESESTLEKLCCYENAECNRRSLPEENFCDFHLNLEEHSNYLRCSYVYDSVQKHQCENLVLKQNNSKFCLKHLIEQEPSAYSFNVETKQNPCGLLLSQKMDRIEDGCLSMSKVDLVDCWSSDGDSFSSSSSSEKSLDLDIESEFTLTKRKKYQFLRRARVFSETEAIQMAIDRWTRYYRMCCGLLKMYRKNLVNFYTPYAVRKHLNKKNSSKIHNNNTLNFDLSQANDPESGEGDKKSFENQEMKLLRSLYNSRISRERTSLRRFGRHSVRVANQRYQNAVSKYAIMCSLMAPWKKNSSGQVAIQQCKYKDPTLTTWEKSCNQTAVPLLSFCFQHLVCNSSYIGNLPMDSPLDPDASHQQQHHHTPGGFFDFSPNCDTPISPSPHCPVQSPTPSSLANPTSVTSSNDGNIAKQCLFRSCGHFQDGKVCLQPVIGWSSNQRCVRHTTVQDLWPDIQNSVCNNNFITTLNNNNSEVSLNYEEIVVTSNNNMDQKDDDEQTPMMHKNEIKEEEGDDNPGDLYGIFKENFGYDQLENSDTSKQVKREEKEEEEEEVYKEDEHTTFDLQNYSSQTNGTDSATDEESIKNDDVILVHGFRSPIGKLCGALSELDAHEITGQVLKGLLDHLMKVNLRPMDHLNQVIIGQVLTGGAGQNPARIAANAAGIPLSVPSYGVNMVCGSGMLSIGLCHDTLKLAQEQEETWSLAGGQESMSRAPHLIRAMRANCKAGGVPAYGDVTMLDAVKFDGLTDAFGNGLMGDTAENISEMYDITREEQDDFAMNSHRKYLLAKDFFQAEIIPIKLKKANEIMSCDECPKPSDKLEAIKRFSCVFSRKHGERTVTAGNACPLNDGSAMVAMTNGSTLKRNLEGIKLDEIRGQLHLCKIIGWSKVGIDPSVMGLGPISAINKLVKNIEWNLADVDYFEINEAFACQSIAVLRETGINPDKVNVGGGSIAIGHPLGASGARIVVSLMHRLSAETIKNGGKKKGIASLCIGGGMGIAMAIETV